MRPGRLSPSRLPLHRSLPGSGEGRGLVRVCAVAGWGRLRRVRSCRRSVEPQMEPPRGAAVSLAGNDKLRHVEKDVLIPQIMRDRAKELCSDKVQAFTKCCKETGFLMVVKCRQENTALKDCLVGYYTDPSFYEECKAEYLKQREEYRATGIKKKRQKITSNV
ncbi:COX assembly mitochondrial protein homolog isoform X1 [Numida meleagris]|uniref:COX assembly mitochondrial protein homolog isoform X1 n=1 Tax=Numida meleagris TaxID=8996 RepID=UPI000B3E2F9C|nr:COX assembly mitochondrial protein homolog isoform X1 [Numida meleagris]